MPIFEITWGSVAELLASCTNWLSVREAFKPSWFLSTRLMNEWLLLKALSCLAGYTMPDLVKTKFSALTRYCCEEELTSCVGLL